MDGIAENGPCDRLITFRSGKRPRIAVELRRVGREKVRKFEGRNVDSGTYQSKSHRINRIFLIFILRQSERVIFILRKRVFFLDMVGEERLAVVMPTMHRQIVRQTANTEIRKLLFFFFYVIQN